MVERVKKSKLNLEPGEKPTPVNTRLRNAIILPEMVGGVIGVYTGRDYLPVEIKFNMIGHYLAELAVSYKRTKHSKTGKGATRSSKHVAKT